MEEQESASKAKFVGKSMIWAVVLIVFVLALGSYYAYSMYTAQKEQKAIDTVTPVTIITKKSTSTTPAATTATDMVVDEGVTWQKPEKLGDLGLIKSYQNTSTYYKVGQTKDVEDIILSESYPEGPAVFTDQARFIKKSDGYYLLTKNSFNTSNGYDKSYLGTFKTDTATVFTSLLPDKIITNGDTKMVSGFAQGVADFTNFSTPKKIGSTKWGALYSTAGTVDGQPDTLLKTIYYIQLNDSTKQTYEARPTFLRDDGTFDVTWTNVVGKTAEFFKVAFGGCGLGTGYVPMVNKSSDIATKSQVASTSSGAKMYTVTDQNNALVKYLYGLYSGSREAKDVKSLDIYASNLGLVLWTDAYGSTLVFSNNDYSELAECGKPVIYLYPTKTTTVSVKVGAKVTKSEPAYGNGWQVVAEPNGTLHLGSTTYGSLFWEGLGYGSYPQINSGTVVKRADVEQTIKSQLAYIGLNRQEISDFLEFWLPKMPQSPYVRLTWLQNTEMNALAPLSIKPRPDSTIRVFLDFQGSDNQVPMKAQSLLKMERKGFTVVEWGGLLKGVSRE